MQELCKRGEYSERLYIQFHPPLLILPFFLLPLFPLLRIFPVLRIPPVSLTTTMNEVSFFRPEVAAGFSVVFCFCWLRPIRVSLKFFPEIFTPNRMTTASEWVLKFHDLFQAILPCRLRLGNRVFEDVFLTRPCSNSSMSATKISPRD